VTAAIDSNRLNRYRGQWEFARGTSSVGSTPTDLQIGRSNTCNFKCVYCVDHRIGNTKPRTRLSDAAWTDLSALIPQTEILAFHGISEFFIDPEFFDILKSCADAKATLRLNTNGSVCTTRHLDALRRYPGRIVIDFSLDAATPDTFARIRGWDFWRVVRNIRTFVQCFAERPASTWAAISFVITKSNVHEMVPMVSLAKSLGVDVLTYYTLHDEQYLDWTVEAKHGGRFVYVEETVRNFPEIFNREIERTRKIADLIGMKIEIPAPIAPTAAEEDET
jgi:MoaA/NifB/PqqE/SkfB family radical SAM enzyme